MKLDNFNKYGLLPAQDYAMTFKQLRGSILVQGIKNKTPNWDTKWRKFLVSNLEVLVKQLWKVGIDNIFIDGSFVEDKEHPNDIDGYFECDVKEMPRIKKDLNLLDSYKIWTWDSTSRRQDSNSTKAQLPMWHQYRVELYPHYNQFCGIKDKHGYEQQFPSAFRQSRDDYQRKGIIKIIKG